jgi:hypothetical protein
MRRILLTVLLAYGATLVLTMLVVPATRPFLGAFLVVVAAASVLVWQSHRFLPPRPDPSEIEPLVDPVTGEIRDEPPPLPPRPRMSAASAAILIAIGGALLGALGIAIHFLRDLAFPS